MKAISKAIITVFAATLCVTTTTAGCKCTEKPTQDSGVTPVFTTVKANPVTPVKNQYQSGTCWCYATTALMESEAIRILGITDESQYPDFSEMFTVSKSYQDRAVKYIRVDGKLSPGPGSLSGDLLHIVKDYGIVPQSAMPGKKELPQLRAMDKELKAYFDEVLANHSILKKDWKQKIVKILEKELGECPETFIVDGKEYTPATYRDAMGINADNYITISSFSNEDFYKPMFIEVYDNWRWDSAINIPLDELVQVAIEAIEKGYTIAWDADITEKGFDLVSGTCTIPEESVTQESRQIAYDNKDTVDDHLMQIFGLATDQDGNRWFMVKNSAGVCGAYDGILYASENYFKAKTIGITIHKDALPESVLQKLQCQF